MTSTGSWAPPVPQRDPGSSPPSGPPDPQRRIAGLGWGLALIMAGVLWALSTAGVRLPWEYVLPAAVILVGLALVAGAWWPAARGLIGLGITVGIVASIVLVGPVPLSVGIGDRVHAPASVEELADQRLGVGSLTLDLRELELTQDPVGDPSTVAVRGSLTIGELVVLLPEEAAVEGEARLAMGDIRVDGQRNRGGIAPQVTLELPGSDPPIELDLRVGIGSIEVRR